jgi:hypothetical protein
MDAKLSYAGWLCALMVMFAAIVYSTWRLESVEERVAPTPVATFESRVESVRAEGTDWATGYFYVVGKTTTKSPLAGFQPAMWNQSQDLRQDPPQDLSQNRPPASQPHETVRPRAPQGTLAEDPIWQEIQRSNEAFERARQAQDPGW